MRIGIDCRTFLHPARGERAGVGQYTTHLVESLVKQYPRDAFVLFFNHHVTESPFLEHFRDRKNVRTVFFPVPHYKKYLPLGYAHVIVARIIAKMQCDVFHAPAYVLPLRYRGASVITVHDLAIYKHPEWFPSGQRFSKEVLVPTSLSKARRIIAVSQATKNMIIETFGTTPTRIDVVYEGVAAPSRILASRARAVAEQFQLAPRFFLFIGTLEPRKNLEFLVRAFGDLLEQTYPRFRDVQLVIAGAKGWNFEPIFRAISHSPQSSNIRVLGYVSEEEKNVLLQQALAFVFPSLWEGFGLPVLEAMRVGTPIITSRVSSLPEVGGDACLYIHPRRKKTLESGMQMLLTRPAKRKQLSERGVARAKAFTWQRCAKETHAVYDKIFKSSKR